MGWDWVGVRLGLGLCLGWVGVHSLLWFKILWGWVDWRWVGIGWIGVGLGLGWGKVGVGLGYILYFGLKSISMGGWSSQTIKPLLRSTIRSPIWTECGKKRYLHLNRD